MSVTASQINGNSIDCSKVSQVNIKKTSKPVLLVLCEGNPPVTGGFPSQRASDAESVSMAWRQHGIRWINAPQESTRTGDITKTKQITTKPCAYIMRYTSSATGLFLFLSSCNHTDFRRKVTYVSCPFYFLHGEYINHSVLKYLARFHDTNCLMFHQGIPSNRAFIH